jgi:hypothetical protein
MGGNFLLLLVKLCQEKDFKFKIKNEMILEVSIAKNEKKLVKKT